MSEPADTIAATSAADASLSGTARRLAILKKFGCAIMRGGIAVTSPSPSPTTALMPENENAEENVTTQAISRESGESTNDYREMGASMFTRQPPPTPTPSKAEACGIGGNSTMRRLLDDLHRSRIGFEQDKEAYDNARIENQNMDLEISKLATDSEKATEHFATLAEVAAVTRTDINYAEVRSKVVDGTLKKVEKELIQVFDELHEVRIEAAEIASSYLSEAISFGLQWNGTELGRMNRSQFVEEEMDSLQRQKRQLEFELADFLALKKAANELETEVKELNEKYKKHDDVHCDLEVDLQKRVEDLNATLRRLETEEKEFRRSSRGELEQLQKQITQVQNSIASLQDQSKEAKSASKIPKNANRKKPATEYSNNNNSSSNSNDEEKYMAEAAAEVSQLERERVRERHSSGKTFQFKKKRKADGAFK